MDYVVEYSVNGEIKIEVVKFLLFPKRLRLKDDLDNKETRWLEKANIQQFYSRGLGRWIDFMWMD